MVNVGVNLAMYYDRCQTLNLSMLSANKVQTYARRRLTRRRLVKQLTLMLESFTNDDFKDQKWNDLFLF